MPIQLRSSTRAGLRSFLFRLRQRIPRSTRISVWKRIAQHIIQRTPAQPPFFRSIEIETRTRCNSTCTFCAASIQNDQRPDIRMPDQTYTKIIAELAAIQYHGAIKFFVNNEPLLDPRTAEFIRIAKEALPHARTEVHTNGLKLNPRNGRELLEAGLDTLVINNYCTDGRLHKGVRDFLAETAPHFSTRDIQVHIRQLDERLLNRAGTAPNAGPETQPLPLPCILPFEELVVTADGRVTICCQDHNFDHALGNVNTHTLQQIWHSEPFTLLRQQLRNSQRLHPLCKGCDFKGYKQEHMSPSQALRNRLVGDLLNT